MTSRPSGGPRPAAWLLLKAFPRQEGRAARGDLDEEYVREVRPRRGRIGADLWYWGQVLRSIPHGWGLRRRSRWRGTSIGRARERRSGMDGWMGDVRYAVRGLMARPLFTALAALTLAVGVGGTAAVFSVVEASLLRPPPYQEPDRLVQFWGGFSWRNPEFLLLRDDFPGFTDVFAYTGSSLTLPDPGGGEARVVTGVESSWEIFEVLGVEALRGRTFRQGEDGVPPAPVVVLSHNLWQGAFGGDLEILGRPLELSGVSRTVIGVMPPGFYFPDRSVDLWIPREMAPGNTSGNLRLVGRLREDRDHASMGDELAFITRILDENFEYDDPRWDRRRDAHLTPLHEFLLGDTRPALLLALGATGVILLIACANVAALLLGRMGSRRRELAVRSALGAGRGRLGRQLLTESATLGALAGLAAAGVAAGVFRVLVGTLPLTPGMAGALSMDWTVFGLAMAVALASGVVVGLGPLAALYGTDLKAAMTSRAEGVRPGDRGRLEAGLVVTEVALAVTLVAGAGLLVRSVAELRSLDPGFDPEGVVAVDLVTGGGDFPTRERPRVLSEVARRVSALPPVASAGVIQWAPLQGDGWSFGLDLEDQPEVEESTFYRIVTHDYFETMDIRVVAGRSFRSSDAAADPPLVVVNQAFVDRYWPEGEALGKRMLTGVDDRWATVVGVVENVRIAGLREPIRPARYLLGEQIAYTAERNVLLVELERPEADRAGALAELRRTIREVDPRIALARVDDMEARVAQAMGEARQLMILLGMLGGLALLLGAVGVYGVVSHWVTRRSRAWGILLALGVQPRRVVGLVLRRGGALIAVGGLLGLAGALAGTRILRRFLFGVSPADPATLGLALVVLAVAGFLAAWVPALRASRTDPLTVLREETP